MRIRVLGTKDTLSIIKSFRKSASDSLNCQTIDGFELTVLHRCHSASTGNTEAAVTINIRRLSQDHCRRLLL